MKKFQLFSCIAGIAILLSSCARQHGLELVGHYNPKTETTKSQASVSASPSEDMKSITVANETGLVASTGETTPDLKLVSPSVQQHFNNLNLTEKQERKLDKNLAKVKIKLEKHATQIGKQIQQTELSANKSGKKSGLLSTGDQLLCAIIAIFIPFLGVALYEEGITSHFWISLILTILFYIPGLIYSLVIILGG